MKYIDKFLKKLNTNRNTFVTYILTLITIYLAVDRIVEMLLLIFTGVSVSYWGPIKYTFALACPIFSFLFSGTSDFAKSKNTKVTLLYAYLIGLYIIAISMFVQWVNFFGWLLLISVPNYIEIVTDFSELIKPAFCSLAIYVPLITLLPFIKKIILGIDDSKDMIRSIWDYRGIDLSDKKEGHGAFTCEVFLLTDNETGKTVTMPEKQRFHATIVCGASGTGKTTLVFEPLIARDIERKAFFKEVSKEMGYTALKTGIAVLNKPYHNDYLNENFTLDMLSPVSGKESVYKTYMKKMILNSDIDIIYKNMGLTYVAPDYETISHISEFCNNFNIKFNLVDPSNPASIGLNPFVYDNPSQIAIIISSSLKAMYNTVHDDINEAYKEDLTIQALENLAILLKVMYPIMHDGALPNIDDLLKLLVNFDLVEKMCQIMSQDEELVEKYNIQLAYFKKHFFKDGSARAETEKYVYSAVTQLDNLLRLPGVKSILCNRHNNINFDDALKNGDVTLVCTRRGDLGASSNKAFGLFFLLSMQHSVLKRPGNEVSRIPHFLYIDEFADFVSKATEPLFVLYRKYKVGTIISTQNLDQLDNGTSKGKIKQTILANCDNKIYLGHGSPEDNKWWSTALGQHREWTYSNNMDMSKLEYDTKYGNIKWAWVDYFQPDKLAALPFKVCGYSVIGDNGRPMRGEGKLKFVDAKYKEKQISKTYNFTKYTAGIVEEEKEDKKANKKFNPKYVDFTDETDEINPIQTNTSDSGFLFDNEDAIIFDLKNKKNN